MTNLNYFIYIFYFSPYQNQKNQNRKQNFAKFTKLCLQSNNQIHYNQPPQNDSVGLASNPQAAPTPKNDPPAVSVTLTQEEIEFDEQFRKWEDEFDKWKQANVNHPDKEAYKQYEQQFESVRVQLLQVNLLANVK